MCIRDRDYGGGDEPPAAGGGEIEELTSVEQFEGFIDNEDASVIGAFTVKEVKDPAATIPEGWDAEEDGAWEAPTIENPALTSFKSITNSLYGYRFAVTYDPDVLAKLKQKSKAGLYLYRSPKFLSKEHGDRPRERYPSEKLTNDGVTNWLNAKAQPLVGKYSSMTQDRYKGPTLVIFMNLDLEGNAKGVNYVLKRARKAAAGLKGKLNVAVASSTDMSFELADYGLESKSPKSELLMGIRANGKFYGAPGVAFSAAALTKFADDFLAGSLTEHIKPEPEPSEVPPADEDGDDMDDAGMDHDEP